MGHSYINVSLTYLRGLEVAELKEKDMPMVLENNLELQTILKDEIYEVKVKKLSVLKSLRLY